MHNEPGEGYVISKLKQKKVEKNRELNNKGKGTQKQKRNVKKNRQLVERI